MESPTVRPRSARGHCCALHRSFDEFEIKKSKSSIQLVEPLSKFDLLNFIWRKNSLRKPITVAGLEFSTST